MRTLFLVLLTFICHSALVGMNMIVDDIDHDSVTVNLRRNGILRFQDNAGELFFIRCENYTFSQKITFSSYSRQFTTSGEGCQALLQDIQTQLESGSRLHSLEVQIISVRNRSEQIFVQPHYL